MINKYNKNNKGFTLMEIALVIALIGILLSFAIPNIMSAKLNANLLVIKHDTKLVQTSMVSQLITGSNTVIEGRVRNIDPTVDKKRKIANKVFMNGENSFLSKRKVDLKEHNRIKKDVDKNSLYKLSKEYLVKNTGTELKGDFYANSTGDIYYVTNISSENIDKNDVGINVDQVISGSGKPNISGGNTDGEDGGEETEEPDDSDLGGELPEDREALLLEIEKLTNERNRLNEAITKLEKEKASLKTDETAYISKIERYKKEKEDVEKKLKDLEDTYKDKLSAKNKEIKDLENKIKDAGDKDKLTSELKDLKSEKDKMIKDHDDKVESINKSIKELKDEKPKLDNEKTELVRKEKELKLEEDKLNKEINDLNTAADKKAKEILGLTNDLKAKTEELIKLEELNNSKLQDKQKELEVVQGKKEQLEGNLVEKNKEIKDTTTALNKEKETNLSLNSKIETVEGEITTISADLNKTNSDNATLTASIETLTNEKAELVEKNNTVKSNISKLEEKIKDLNNDALLKELDGYKTELEEKVNQVTNLVKLNGELNLNIVNLEKENTTLSQSLNKIKADIETTKSEHETKINSINKQISELSGDKESNLTTIKEKKIELEGQLEKLKELTATLDSETKNLKADETKLEGLNKEIQEVESNIASLNTELSKLQKEQSDLKTSITNLEENIATKDNSIKTINNQIAAINKEIKTETDKKNTSTEILNGKKDEIAKLNSSIESITKEKDLQSNKLKDQKAVHSGLLKQIGEKQEELSSLKVKNEKDSKEKADLTNSNKVKQETVNKLKTEVAKLNTDISNKDKEITRINALIKKTNEDITALKNEESELVIKIEAGNTKLKSLSDTETKLKENQSALNVKTDKIANIILDIIHDRSNSNRVIGIDFTSIDKAVGDIEQTKALIDPNLLSLVKSSLLTSKTKANIIVAIDKEIKQIGDYASEKKLSSIKSKIDSIDESKDKEALLRDYDFYVRMITREDIKIKQVALGWYHSAAITEDGKVYTWGRSGDGKLGHGNDTENKSTPTPIKNAFDGKKVTQVSLGFAHSAALTEDGKLYTWGSDMYGELGHGDTQDRNTPTLIEKAFDGKKVVQVSLGSRNSAALTEDGKLYTWGNGDDGRLGHGDYNRKYTPTLIEKAFDGKKVTQVSLGGKHSAALTEDGQVYTWGKGEYGRLGHGNDTENKSTPTPIKKAFDGKKVTQVSLGFAHSAALTEDGKLYTWGNDMYGKLGHGNTRNKTTPTPVESLSGEKVVQVALGYSHSAALTEDGQVYTWGDSDYGMLGHGADTKNKSTPTLIKNAFNGKKVVQVSLGSRNSAALTEDGQVYTWGGGGDGELGHGDTQDKPTPTKITTLIKIEE